jgi:hypothetical protein
MEQKEQSEISTTSLISVGEMRTQSMKLERQKDREHQDFCEYPQTDSKERQKSQTKHDIGR